MPLLAAAWSAQDSGNIVVGGHSRTLKILDVRVMGHSDGPKPVMWKRENAHEGAIRAVSWNPLVANWIASAGMFLFLFFRGKNRLFFSFAFLFSFRVHC